MFEMGSGSCTESAVPSEADYSKVKDGSVRKFLRKVFADVEAGAATSREWTAEVSYLQSIERLQCSEFCCSSK